MFTALASLSLLLAAAPAVPQDQATHTARVHVSDLNLNSAAGRAELDKRLASAVATVCPDVQTIADPRAVQQARSCKSETRVRVARQRQAVLAAAGVPADQMASSGR
jgi:UrcA family protein